MNTHTSANSHTVPSPRACEGLCSLQIEPKAKGSEVDGTLRGKKKNNNVMVSLLWVFSGYCNSFGPQILVILFSEAAELQVIAFGKSQIADGFCSDQIYFNSQ